MMRFPLTPHYLKLTEKTGNTNNKKIKKKN